MHSILEELDWAVTFQMESLLRSMAIDFVEALDLLPGVIIGCMAQQGDNSLHDL